MAVQAQNQALRVVEPEPTTDRDIARPLRGGLDELRQEPPPARRSTDKQDLRKVMGEYATGAAIVTSEWNGKPHGMAVNSFTSVSLEPPMILFCPDKRSETWPAIWRSGHFTVNILGADDHELCRQFARKGSNRFADIPFAYAPSGSPVLRDAVAFLECRIERVHDAGDHFITIGRVLDLGTQREAPPLIFYRGAFHRLAGDDDDSGAGVA